MTGDKKETYTLMFPRNGSRLHSMMVNCGHETVHSTSYNWNGMLRGSHELLIWQYTLAGQGALAPPQTANSFS